MSVKYFKNGQLTLIAGAGGISGGGDCDCDSKIFTGTAAEYEAQKDNIEDGTIINITDDIEEGTFIDIEEVLNKIAELEADVEDIKQNGSGASSADNVTYDSTASGLEAATVQEAIDEMTNNLGGLRFGTDGDGNFGYYGADGSLIPFKSGETIVIEPLVPTLTSSIGSDGGEAFASSEYNNVRNAWRAFSNEILDPVSAGSGYWYPNLNQIDSWLAYDFKVPTVVKEFKMHCAAQTAGDVEFGFQAYINDNWEIVHTETCSLLTNENANNYKLFNFKFDKVKTASKWRIVTYGTNAVAIHAAQFYGYKYKALVPILTSNTADDGGLALASSFQTGYEQWRVFDGNKYTYWVPANVTGSGQSVIPAYVQYNLTKPEIVKAFKITNTLYGYDCKDIILYGANNNSLTEIGKYVAPAGESAETIFYVENENAYTSYRLTINTGHGNYVGMSELQFYTTPGVAVSELPVSDIDDLTLLYWKDAGSSNNYTHSYTCDKDYEKFVIMGATTQESSMKFTHNGKEITGIHMQSWISSNGVTGYYYKAVIDNAKAGDIMTFGSVYTICWMMGSTTPSADAPAGSLKGKSATSLISANVNYHITIPTCGCDIKVTFSSLGDDMGFWGSNNGLRDEANVILTKDTSTNVVSCKEYDFLLISAIKGGSYTNATYEWV